MISLHSHQNISFFDFRSAGRKRLFTILRLVARMVEFLRVQLRDVEQPQNRSLELYRGSVNTPKFVHAVSQLLAHETNTRSRHGVAWFTVDCIAPSIACIYSDTEKRARARLSVRSYRGPLKPSVCFMFRIDVIYLLACPIPAAADAVRPRVRVEYTYLKLSAQLSN